MFLRSNKHPYHFRLSIHNNSAVYFGANNYMNTYGGAMQILLSEQKHFVAGDGCTMSFNIWVRNSDPHLLYSTETHRRLNPTRSVFIGDHVWLGQYVTLLKGTRIGSGSVIGANSVVSGKLIPSNTAWAGNPARKLRDNVFWTGPCVHQWTAPQTNKYSVMNTDQYTYAPDDTTLSFDEIDARLSACKDAEERLNCLLELSGNEAKNRFAV